MSEYNGKKVLVLGLARSGLAAVKLLVKLGADVTVSESKDLDSIKELPELLSWGVRVVNQDKEIFEEDFYLAVKNPGINGNLWFVKRLRERGIPVITEIELAFRVSAPQHYVAITGSNGKTTTATLTYEIIKAQHPDKTLLCGNIGVALCEMVLEHDLINNDGFYIVLEISNFQLVDIVDFCPEIAVIINLAADHLDFMGTEDAYFRSKLRVYENMKKGKTFLYNLDDELIKTYTQAVPVNCDVLTYSLVDKTADLFADSENVYFRDDILFPLSDIKVVGRHNVQNVLVGVGCALKCAVSPENIRKAVSLFKGVEHRIEFVREKDGICYYNDSKGTNVDATVIALKAFSSPVILLAGGHEKGLDLTPLKGLLSGVKKVISYGECGERIWKELTDGEGILVNDLPEAMSEAVKIAEAGDVVLLSPTTSSYDQYTCFEERGEHFKTLVNSL
ncbi:MAG: UDP-N-acetylmuramoyl-L-alanine--D-glutamate ligase [Ruminococcaceae bacterium]|nr:UDP-N-acetylmuramoyl-L-alanine--D-glutamate ligase [Oscillospiraceae bacterium]